MTAVMPKRLRVGFRRRCAWCGVVLRGWQLNLCRRCKRAATGDCGIYLQGGGPPCREGSRWHAEPDPWIPRDPKEPTDA